MPFGFGSDASPLQQSLRNRAYSTQGFSPNPSQGVDFGDILPPIQTEIGRSGQEGQNLLSDFLSQRQGFQGQLRNDLMDQMNAGLTASVPGIEDRLQSLGLLQSGAYPEAIERQKANILSSSILPQLTGFDLGTFDTASQIPMNTMNRIQGLQSGSLGRQFGLQDIANQQQFTQGLANQAQQTQKLQALLGLLPSLIGQGGLPGLFGGGFGGGQGSGQGGSGGILGSLGGLMGGQGGLGSILGSAGLGALGPAIGGAMGMGGVGQGALGGLGGILGGGGIPGGIGAGIGGALGGPLGGAIGGAGGDILNQWVQGQGGWSDLLGLGGGGMVPGNPTNLPVMDGTFADPLANVFGGQDLSQLPFLFQ